MPHPAFARLRKTVLLLGAASGVVTVARKALAAARPARPTIEPETGPATAAAPSSTAPAGPEVAPTAVEVDAKPSPASIAKNVPHQRPAAAPAPEPHARAEDSPGGKLPPRR